jgi:hypothetical protein
VSIQPVDIGSAVAGRLQATGPESVFSALLRGHIRPVRKCVCAHTCSAVTTVSSPSLRSRVKTRNNPSGLKPPPSPRSPKTCLFWLVRRGGRLEPNCQQHCIHSCVAAYSRIVSSEPPRAGGSSVQAYRRGRRLAVALYQRASHQLSGQPTARPKMRSRPNHWQQQAGSRTASPRVPQSRRCRRHTKRTFHQPGAVGARSTSAATRSPCAVWPAAAVIAI